MDKREVQRFKKWYMRAYRAKKKREKLAEVFGAGSVEPLSSKGVTKDEMYTMIVLLNRRVREIEGRQPVIVSTMDKDEEARLLEQIEEERKALCGGR